METIQIVAEKVVWEKTLLYQLFITAAAGAQPKAIKICSIAVKELLLQISILSRSISSVNFYALLVLLYLDLKIGKIY